MVVAEVRETSRKPDEMYSLLERLSPGTRKIEIFARSHNLNPGWVGLGNQLNGVQVRGWAWVSVFRGVGTWGWVLWWAVVLEVL